MQNRGGKCWRYEIRRHMIKAMKECVQYKSVDFLARMMISLLSAVRVLLCKYDESTLEHPTVVQIERQTFACALVFLLFIER